MTRVLLLALALAGIAAAEKPPVGRESLKRIEEGLDRTIASLDVNDPYDVVGSTRGLYLPGYGIVFTTEVNLVVTAISPFHMKPDAAGIVRLQEKKLRRLAVLKEALRDTLVNAGATLQGVPAGEQLTFAVLFYYRTFERREGLPDQIMIQTTLQALADVRASRAARDTIRIEEQ